MALAPSSVKGQNPDQTAVQNRAFSPVNNDPNSVEYWQDPNASLKFQASGGLAASGGGDPNVFGKRDLNQQDEAQYQLGTLGTSFSSDPYERAQQDRNFHQTDAFKNSGHWDALSPGKQLEESLGTDAYNFRKGLGQNQLDASNDIKHQAGGLMGQGLQKIRSSSNHRGLLYSGMREGAEGDFRGKVANTMASQIASSNSDLAKTADKMDQGAASVGLLGADRAMQTQSDAQKMQTENAVMRGQQMQQLGSQIGYGFNRSFDQNVVSKQQYSNGSY